jgi:hypothetical protein
MLVHKTQSGRTLPRILCKRELRAPGCPLCILGIYWQISMEPGPLKICNVVFRLNIVSLSFHLD